MRIFRIIGWIALAGAFFVISAAVGGYFYLRSTVPSYAGNQSVTGISGKVEIIRDDFGMPHIFADSPDDVAFGLGYALAQDRLFQMDMIRRAVRGRMAEVAGPSVLRIDKLFRVITAPQPVDSIYNTLPIPMKRYLTAFAGGVNAWMASEESKLPFEFSLLSYKPEPWAPSDCLTGLYYMAWSLNFAFENELTREILAQELSEEMLADLYPTYTAYGPRVVEDERFLGDAKQILETIKLARTLYGQPYSAASNNWVVSGSRTASGKPMVANDMHLGLGLPGVWYEAHLICDSFDVSGVVLPTVPMIIAGANRACAWGFTNFMVDESDFYMERINPDNRDQYEVDGAWQDMEIRTDTITIKGHEPYELKIRLSNHGAIINDVISHLDTAMARYQALALRWAVYDFNTQAEAVYKLAQAQTIYDIQKSAALFKSPGQNWVCADTAGNIAYFAAGSIPRRHGFDGTRFLPGWNSDFDWDSYVPDDSMPSLINPHKGYIATANNKTTGDDYPYYISQYFVPGDRAERIEELLAQDGDLTVDKCAVMQSDHSLPFATRWVPILIDALGSAELRLREQQARDLLKEWDFEARADAVAPTVFHTVFQQILENTLRPHLGDRLFQTYVQSDGFTVQKAIQHIFLNENSPWFDQSDTEERETRSDVIVESFRQAVTTLEKDMGPEVSAWQWGKVHNLTFYHDLGRHIPIIGGFMNAGPFPMSGSNNSVDAGLYSLAAPFDMKAGASQRHIFDLSDINNSRRILPSGISGNFMSRHYVDQMPLWLNGEYRPFVLDRPEADTKGYSRLILQPETTVVPQNPANSD